MGSDRTICGFYSTPTLPSEALTVTGTILGGCSSALSAVAPVATDQVIPAPRWTLTQCGLPARSLQRRATPPARRADNRPPPGSRAAAPNAAPPAAAGPPNQGLGGQGLGGSGVRGV